MTYLFSFVNIILLKLRENKILLLSKQLVYMKNVKKYQNKPMLAIYKSSVL